MHPPAWITVAVGLLGVTLAVLPAPGGAAESPVRGPWPRLPDLWSITRARVGGPARRW
jgi:hypothetical protein